MRVARLGRDVVLILLQLGDALSNLRDFKTDFPDYSVPLDSWEPGIIKPLKSE